MDYYIYGDGSGTTQSKTCGSAVSIYDSEHKHLITLSCACSKGTNNFAELLPLTQALWWLGYNSRLKNQTNIRITSDSEVTIKSGTGEYQIGYQNEILWFGIKEVIKKYDLKMEWVHVKRNTSDIMTEMDKLAKESNYEFRNHSN